MAATRKPATPGAGATVVDVKDVCRRRRCRRRSSSRAGGERGGDVMARGVGAVAGDCDAPVVVAGGGVDCNGAHVC